MNRPELTSIVADKVNTTKKQADEVIDAFLETIIEALQNGDKVVLTGFGTFEAHDRAERVGRNPITGEEISIPGSKAPTFKASKAFKDSLN